MGEGNNWRASEASETLLVVVQWKTRYVYTYIYIYIYIYIYLYHLTSLLMHAIGPKVWIK